MSKKDILALCKAHEEEFNEKHKNDKTWLEGVTEINHLAFTASDCQVNVRENGASVTAKVDNKTFGRILEMNMATVISYLEEKGFELKRK